MAWSMRITGMLVILTGTFFVLGCTSSGGGWCPGGKWCGACRKEVIPRDSYLPGSGLPVSPVGEKKNGDGQPVARGQQPSFSPGDTRVNLVSSPPKEELPAALIAEKYEVRICAWVNGKPIFKGDVLNEAIGGLIDANKLPEPARSAKRKEILEKKLKYIIDQELVYQDAVAKLEKSPTFMKKLREAANQSFENEMVRAMMKSSGVRTRDELNQILQLRHGSSLETLRLRQEREFFVGEYIRSRTQPYLTQISPQAIREYYETHQNEFQTLDRVEWEDLFVATGKYQSREKAEEVAKYIAYRLQAGDPITNLLKYDDGLLSATKDKKFVHRKGEISPPELEPYLFQMKPGQVGPIHELSTGFHVFRLLHRDYAGLQPLSAEVQKKIRNKLAIEIHTRELDRIVRQLAATAVIEVDEETLR
jgi:peptidyl-prolyl cis-trans isomerase SurA